MRSDHRPMITKRRAVIAALVIILLAGVAGTAGLIYFFGNKAPGSVSIDDAASVVASAFPSGATGGSGADLDGTWTVSTAIGTFSDYTSTWAGFRVDEVLSNIGNNTAIGRTSSVSGQLTLSGATLTATTINVDLTSVTSDQARRDPAIQRTLETSSYPTATFELTAPVSLPQTPVEGITYNVTASGNMTIHNVTRQIQVTLQAQLKNGVIIVVGSTPFSFNDYNMTAPAAPIVLSVSDSGTIEFQLFLMKS
jgi:polyisoprenoid-binding protein YceI